MGIKENIQKARLKAQHANMLQYTLPKELKISEVFDLIEKNKESHRIQDYSLSQTTLDDVFVEFARKQVTDDADDAASEHNNPLEQKEIDIVPRKTLEKPSTALRRSNSRRLSSTDNENGVPL